MGKRIGTKKALESNQALSKKSKEETLSPATQFKEIVDPNDELGLENKENKHENQQESESEEIEAVINLEVKLIFSHEDLDIEII